MLNICCAKVNKGVSKVLSIVCPFICSAYSAVPVGMEETAREGDTSYMNDDMEMTGAVSFAQRTMRQQQQGFVSLFVT
jgi:hypothetical protein